MCATDGRCEAMDFNWAGMWSAIMFNFRPPCVLVVNTHDFKVHRDSGGPSPHTQNSITLHWQILSLNTKAEFQCLKFVIKS